MIYDVAILGGGVVGCAILNKLTRIGKKCVLLEKGSDVAIGASKANSGIVHAGYDAKNGTLKARLNVRGAELFPKLCQELSVPLVNNGALVIGNDERVVTELYERGLANGVQGLEVLNRKELLKKLPSITEDITCALYAKTSSIVSPYKLTIALAEESVINGAHIVFNFNTTQFMKVQDGYELSNGKDSYIAKIIILAVGSAHNEIAELLGTSKYDIVYRRGEYYLLDKGAMDIGAYTIFPLPSKAGKGVLISPTTSGNIIVGPTSIISENDSVVTTKDGLDDIASKANAMLSNVNLRKNIRVFSGVRTIVGDDFVIEKDKSNEDIISVTGICSPGLSSAPAIAEYIVNLLGYEDKELDFKRRSESPKISGKTLDDVNKLISHDKRYGKIVCRCESVSEMEIVNAIHSPLQPRSVDAIKRRTRAGMGRCQGGFCFLKVMEIIARETGLTIDEVTKENLNSRIIIGDIK